MVRLAWLLTELTGPPLRQSDEVPDWLTQLVNDQVNSTRSYRENLSAGWTPEFLTALLAAASVPREARSRMVFLVLFEAASKQPAEGLVPADLPGVIDFLERHPVPPGVAARLSLEGRQRLARRAAGDPALAGAHCAALTALSLDPEREVRNAAVAALRLAPPTAVLQSAATALAAASTGEVAELARLLSETATGQLLLQEVPPVLLAEAYADYAAFATLGPYDPDYLDKTRG